MDHDKAIRAAKLTLGGMLEKRRAEEAKQRAPGQIAPSKYLPNVPRAAHASGGYVPMANLPVARLAVAKPSVYSQQPTAMDALSSLASIGKTVKGFSDTISGENVPPQQTHAGRAEPHEGGLTPEATAAMEDLRKGWSGDEFGIVSGYRDPEHNERVGGAKDSQHTHGNAYDVDTTGWTPEQKLALADEAWNAGFRGFGFYDNNMHFDVADPRAWGPSYSRDSIPEWAQGWAQQRYGYADGGPVASNDNFQSWFGNSVTHTDGEPHVFYTGTSKDKDFTSFNVGRHGAWFTRDPQVASSYAEQNDSQGYKRDGWNMVKTNTASRVIPAYVKAENPYTGELPQEFMRDNYKAAQSDWFDTLRAKGHDAWMPASQGGNLLVALKEPHQIKSIYNSGKFDPKQKHMNKAAGGAAMFEGIHEDLQNEDGTPKELWHGTLKPDGFSEFKDEKLGARDAGFYGRGHYLTPDKETAQEYTEDGWTGDWGGKLMGPLHAALKNPYVWDASDKGAHSTLRDLQSMGIMKGQDKLEPWDNLQGHHIRPFMNEMQKRGHDGVIVRTNDHTGEKPHRVSEVVVFKPSAIKHRDAERFDPNDPNIYRANGGAIK